MPTPVLDPLANALYLDARSLAGTGSVSGPLCDPEGLGYGDVTALDVLCHSTCLAVALTAGIVPPVEDRERMAPRKDAPATGNGFSWQDRNGDARRLAALDRLSALAPRVAAALETARTARADAVQSGRRLFHGAEPMTPDGDALLWQLYAPESAAPRYRWTATRVGTDSIGRPVSETATDGAALAVPVAGWLLGAEYPVRQSVTPERFLVTEDDALWFYGETDVRETIGTGDNRAVITRGGYAERMTRVVDATRSRKRGPDVSDDIAGDAVLFLAGMLDKFPVAALSVETREATHWTVTPSASRTAARYGEGADPAEYARTVDRARLRRWALGDALRRNGYKLDMEPDALMSEPGAQEIGLAAVAKESGTDRAPLHYAAAGLRMNDSAGDRARWEAAYSPARYPRVAAVLAASDSAGATVGTQVVGAAAALWEGAPRGSRNSRRTARFREAVAPEVGRLFDALDVMHGALGDSRPE